MAGRYIPPSSSEVIRGKPDAEVGGESGFVFLYEYRYRLDLGTMLDDADDQAMIELAQDVIGWARRYAQKCWAWRIHDVMEDDDCRNVLWISFDDPGDAMLSRMTWLDLKVAECLPSSIA
jgi:hypothetical protein